MEAGFPIVARGAGGEIRAIESPTHRFFLATLFQPQLSSTEKKPHPVVLAFVQAAADWGRKKLDDSVLDRYVRQRRTVNIEYVQDSSIRNKRTLEEVDPQLRRQRLEEMRCASLDRVRAKDVLMRSSMIASMRRADAIT